MCFLRLGLRELEQVPKMNWNSASAYRLASQTLEIYRKLEYKSIIRELKHFRQAGGKKYHMGHEV